MKTQEITQPGGEKDLIEQIAILQKQLDNCMENEKGKKSTLTDEKKLNLLKKTFITRKL